MGFVVLTVEGRPFWVRPEAVVAIGTGYTSLPPEKDGGEPVRVVTTMVTVTDVGTIPVEESVEGVLSVVGERVTSTGGTPRTKRAK